MTDTEFFEMIERIKPFADSSEHSFNQPSSKFVRN